ncbi:hypothetical protein [Mycobacterium sp. URHB0021]
MREIGSWPEGREFGTLELMMWITLNAFPRAVFGAQGTASDELRQMLPPMVPLLETTATTLPWAIPRLRRHPRLLARLTTEPDAGGSGLRQATIWEVRRTRPVIDAPARAARRRDPAGRPVMRRDAERVSV